MSFIHQISYGASNRREETSGRDLPEPTAKFQNLDNTNFDDVHEGIVQYFNRAGLAKFLDPAYAPLDDEDYDLEQASERRKRKQEKEIYNGGKLQSMALLQRFIAPTGFAHTATSELFKNEKEGGNFFIIWDLLLNAFEGKTLTALYGVIRAIIALFQDGPKGGDVLECIDNGMRILKKLGRFGPREDAEGHPMIIHDHEISETVQILLVLAIVGENPEHREVIDELVKKYVLLAEDQTDFDQVTYEKLMPKLRSLMAADNAKRGPKAESHNTLVSSPGGGQKGAGGAPAGVKPTCTACGKKGHEEKDCWVKHPEKKKSFEKKSDAKKSFGGKHGKHQHHRGGGGRSRGGGRFRGRGQRGGRDGGQRGGGRGHYDPAAPAHERSGAGAYTGNTEVVNYDSDYYSDDRLKFVFSNNTELEERKPGDYGDGGADYGDGAEIQIHHTMMDPEEEETEVGDSEDESESEESTFTIGAEEKGTLVLRPARKSCQQPYYGSGDESESSDHDAYEVHNVGTTRVRDESESFDWFQASDEKEEKEEGELREVKETLETREDRIARRYLQSVRPPEGTLLISPSRHKGIHHVRETYTGELDTPHPRGIALRFVRSLSQQEREEFLKEVDEGGQDSENEVEEEESCIDDGQCARSRPRTNTRFRTLDGTEASASTSAIGQGNPILREIENFKQTVQSVQDEETEYLEEDTEEEEKKTDRPKKRGADEPVGGAEKKDNRDPDNDPAPGGGTEIAGGLAIERTTRVGEVEDRDTDSTGPPSLIEIEDIWRNNVSISRAFPRGTTVLNIAQEQATAYGEIRVPLLLRTIGGGRDRTFGRGVYGEYILVDNERYPPDCGPTLPNTIRAIPITNIEEALRINSRTRDAETLGRIPGAFLNHDGFPRRLPESNPTNDPRLAMIRVAPMPREGIQLVPPGERMWTTTRTRTLLAPFEPELGMVTPGSFYRNFEGLEASATNDEPEGEEKSSEDTDIEIFMIRAQRSDHRENVNESTDILSDSGATHSVVNETFPLLNERPAKGIVKTSNTSEDPNQITGVGEYLFLGRRCKAFRCRGMSKSLLAENDITRQHPITFTRSNGRCVVKDQETGEEHVIETKRGLSVLPLSLINGSA